jgi:carbon-monoxide dehydrogenase iron sulfur subunit
MAKMIVFDAERCMACKSCMLACALAHSEAGSLVEAVASGTLGRPRVHVEALGESGMPLQCRHCQDAPCIAICPTGAIARETPDSPVVLDAERCIGCRFCVVVCPFGVIEESPDGKAMTKCDLCIERTKAGQPPACVAACPACGLKFVEVDDWVGERRKKAAVRLAVEAGGGGDDEKP